MSKDNGCPMPPAAPRMATFLPAPGPAAKLRDPFRKSSFEARNKAFMFYNLSNELIVIPKVSDWKIRYRAVREDDLSHRVPPKRSALHVDLHVL